MTASITIDDLPLGVKDALGRSDRSLALSKAKLGSLRTDQSGPEALARIDGEVRQHQSEALVDALGAVVLILGQIQLDLAALGKVP